MPVWFNNCYIIEKQKAKCELFYIIIHKKLIIVGGVGVWDMLMISNNVNFDDVLLFFVLCLGN